MVEKAGTGPGRVPSGKVEQAFQELMHAIRLLGFEAVHRPRWEAAVNRAWFTWRRHRGLMESLRAAHLENLRMRVTETMIWAEKKRREREKQKH